MASKKNSTLALRYSVYDSKTVPSWEEILLPPRPGRGKIRIVPDFGSINPVDWKIMAGEQRLLSGRLPRSFGAEGCGTVLAVGPGVKRFKPGARVCYMVNPLGRAGVFAGLADLPAFLACGIPQELEPQRAAALPVASLTAQRALGKLAGFLDKPGLGGSEAGKRVLVIGASGGVGSLLARYLIELGFRVDLGGSPEKLAACGFFPDRNGVGRLLDRKRQAPGSDGARWDLVFDCHGALFDAHAVGEILAPRGLLVNVSLANDRIFPALTLPLRGIRNRLVLALPDRKLLERGLRLAASSRALPTVGAVYPWREAAEAIFAQRRGEHHGKVLVDLRGVPRA